VPENRRLQRLDNVLVLVAEVTAKCIVVSVGVLILVAIWALIAYLIRTMF
jgi:hypothetical protein